jgi:hypothetical protein
MESTPSSVRRLAPFLWKYQLRTMVGRLNFLTGRTFSKSAEIGYGHALLRATPGCPPTTWEASLLAIASR